jgi:hypothetical protein
MVVEGCCVKLLSEVAGDSLKPDGGGGDQLGTVCLLVEVFTVNAGGSG